MKYSSVKQQPRGRTTRIEETLEQYRNCGNSGRWVTGKVEKRGLLVRKIEYLSIGWIFISLFELSIFYIMNSIFLINVVIIILQILYPKLIFTENPE